MEILNSGKAYLGALVFTLLAGVGLAQNITQQVKGNITDALTTKPLTNASVVLMRDSLVYGTTTDDKGNFVLENIPLGRYQIKVSFTGYAGYEEELLVISGRSVQQEIALTETAIVLNEVQVGSIIKAQDYAPGLQTIGIEKTMRIPANFFDPVRMATSYPGVVAANDQGNAIIVKGNSPNGLLWRLNGLDIVNPNHLANAGTLSDKPISNGGGVNILSAQMLDRTQFYTGAFPAAYGNALSGILDMNLREGNKNKMEGTAQASLLGLDLSLETPMSKSQSASALVNYRYSTVGLLSKLGVQFGDEEISFQDLSMNLSFDQKNGGKISVFGFYGDSKNKFEAKEPADWEEDKDKYNINYKSTTYAIGMNYVVPIGRGSLFAGVAYSSSDQSRKSEVSDFIPINEERILYDSYSLNRGLVSSNIRYSTKVGAKSTWDIGVMTNFMDDDASSTKTTGAFIGPMFQVSEKGYGSGVLVQPFTTWRTAFNEKLAMNLGVRYLNYTYNKTSSFEPRASLTYSVSTKTIFDLCMSNRNAKNVKFNINSSQILSDCNVSNIVQFDFSI
ncbi:MAG TPA: carboxypeptidase-like regulatory domain-containing protein, partial [Chryseolinea sp.]|nr:carboxypeptidase-like regulatory domain-containing protein [Chryseolinea sp.]